MAAKKSLRRGVLPAISVAAALTLTGCLQNPDAGGGGGGFDPSAEPDEGDGVVEVLGAFGGQEEEAFVESLKPFEDETGIDVQYVSDSDFATTVLLRSDSGDPPDIGLFPQPGGVQQLAEKNAIVPIDQIVDYDAINATLVPGFLDAARFDGRVYAAPMRMAVKSIVWYPKAPFEENGWNTEPESLAELDKLSEQIMQDSKAAPWCLGWENAQATGWVGTDWVEEYMLRLHGPDVYDNWMYGRIPFDDPRVVEAIQAYYDFSTKDGNVLGGADGILNTPFGDAMAPAFRDNPGCMMMRQGNFATGFFPEDVQANLDEEIGIFPFPKAAPGEGYDGQPVLGGGDLAAAFTYDTDTQALMEFLTSDEFGAEWAQAGGWLSPHTTFDVSNYPDETTRRTAEMAYEADIFRYDASDVMPKEVGSDSFWKGMIELQSGDKDAEQVAKDIWSAWPEDQRDLQENLVQGGEGDGR